MQKLNQDPRLQLIVGLVFFFVFTIQNIPTQQGTELLTFCVLFCLVFDVIFSYWKLKKVIPPYSALITALILALVVDPVAGWHKIAIISFFAIASKHFIQRSSKHIFNPAAFGLLLVWLIFNEYPAWWAASLNSPQLLSLLNLPILLMLGFIFWVSGFKFKRYYVVLSYLLTFGLLFELFISFNSSVESFARTLTNVGMLFFAFLMLPEPKTTPIKNRQQIIYGSLIAALNVGFTYLTLNTNLPIPDASVAALLVGNLVHFARLE
uniref:RnfABCDGE type electron transport complex subunit D n=1 Tax=candidate division WWE3 bacterium TaxID=2053526 RepID=A0A7C4XMR4_UNCKA